MSSIHILPSEIINQIAAGEVVERPAHLVKELLENSLDAGADHITVDIARGGKYIRVIDNGAGILASDLTNALQRHATSKIKKTDDLWNLHTFGFRGEALASAAAVSKLTLKSIEKTEKKSSQIDSVFGAVTEIKPSSTQAGTEIIIDSLFENVPARLKFLKSDSSESQQIKNVIKALALAHHQVEFKLVIDGNLQLFYSAKKNKIDRVQEIFEKKNLFEAVGSRGSYRCHVVFSSPQEVAKTSKQIWIFAQNRWVQDRAIQAAVMDAYRSLLMHGEYPYVALWLDCDPAEVDVNIHPTKSQIKFQDASQAFRVVQSTLRGALEKAPWIVKNNYSEVSVGVSNQSTADYKSYVQDNLGFSSFNSSQVENLKFSDHRLDQTYFKNKSFNMSDLQELKVNETDTRNIFVENKVESQTLKNTQYWSSLQVLGQADLTYIVCQKNDRLVFVDQHAAHERVVYESLMQSWKMNNFEIQDYLFPLAIDLSEDKVEALLKAEDEIKRLGFHIEQLGPQVIGIKSAPHLIKDSSLPGVFEKMASDLLQNGGSFAIEKKISDLFATMACHSVVRAGQSLSKEEMAELLKSMDQFTLSSFCPHGRPVSVELTFFDLEKLFGRIN